MDTPPRDDLYRALMPGAELRTREDGTNVMVGYFAKFNEWAEIHSVREGRFMERVMPGAFRKTIAENLGSMRVLFHHGLDMVGVQVLGKITELREDEQGAYYEVELFEGVPQLLVDGIRAGVYGASHRFRAMRDDFDPRPRRPDAGNPEGLPERTIMEAKVFEFGPTPFPAYAGATSGIRSITDDVYVRRLAEDPERLQALVRSADTPTQISVPPSSFRLTDTGPTASVTGSSFRLTDINMGIRNPLDEQRAQERKYDRVIGEVASTPWAMQPEALATVLAIVAERASGYRPTQQEIEERIGAPTDSGDVPVDDSGGIRVIPIRGKILPRASLMSQLSGGASVDQLRKDFRAAVQDPDVKAIVLDIDSPGGSATMVPEFGSDILAARGSKPIVASVNANAASAAYWFAAQADEIHVTPSGKVGSIGVWTAHTDVSAMEDQAGIKTTLVSAGKYKVEGNPFEPLSDEAKAQMQAEVDELYQGFLDAVAAGRGTDAETVKTKFGQGRMVTAQAAVKAGMADRVATLDEVLADVRQRLAGDANAADAQAAQPAPAAATTPAVPASEAGAAPHENDTSAGQAATAAAHPRSGRRGLYTSDERKPSWHLP